MSNVPLPFVVPAERGAAATLRTGSGSPVNIDSSTWLAPSMTTPSTGTFSPGRTRRTIFNDDVLERNVTFLAAFVDAVRNLRRQAQERSDRARRLRPRPELEDLPKKNERDDHGRGLEI